MSKERALDVEKTGSLCDKPVLYGISIKAFLVGVLLLAGVIIQGLWTNPAGLIRGLGTDSSVSAAGLAGVIILLAINTVFGRAVFNHSERAAVYIIIALGGYVGVGGVVLPIVCGMIGLQLNTVLYPHSSYNLVLNAVNKFAFPSDPDLIVGYALGSTPIPWRQWIIPLILWFSFAFSIYCLFLSVISLFRYRWTDVEQLTYPIIKPVVSVVESGDSGSFGPIWSDKVLYIGFLLPLLFQGLSILQGYFPYVPTIPELQIAKYLPEGPLRTGYSSDGEVAATVFRIMPSVLALSFFAPLDFLFTFWFTYLFINRGVYVVAAATGYPPRVAWNFQGYQVTGALIGFALFLIWLARTDIKEIIMIAIGKREVNSLPDAQNRTMSARTAVFGIVVLTCFVWFFLVYFCNVNAIIAVFWLVAFTTIALAGCRLRAETGLPFGNSVTLQPSLSYMMQTVTGGAVPVEAIGAMGMTFKLVGMTGLMSQALEIYKLGDKSKLKRTSVTKLLLLAFVIGFWIGVPVYLGLVYKYGSINFPGTFQGEVGWGYKELAVIEASLVRSAIPVTLLGVLITLVLMALRTTYFWWPIHPGGYALAWHNDISYWFWGSIFVAWIIKFFVTRYGGNTTRNVVERFMMGVIIGSVVIGLIGSLVQSIIPPQF